MFILYLCVFRLYCIQTILDFIIVQKTRQRNICIHSLSIVCLWRCGVFALATACTLLAAHVCSSRAVGVCPLRVSSTLQDSVIDRCSSFLPWSLVRLVAFAWSHGARSATVCFWKWFPLPSAKSTHPSSLLRTDIRYSYHYRYRYRVRQLTVSMNRTKSARGVSEMLHQVWKVSVLFYFAKKDTTYGLTWCLAEGMWVCGWCGFVFDTQCFVST